MLFAACQWSSARSSIGTMHQLGHKYWTETHGFYADSGGYLLSSPDMPSFPVDTRALHYMIEYGYLDLPVVPKLEILDRSKTNKFTMAVAAFQIIWLVVQCIARLVQSQDISPLEDITVAFTVSTIATFFYWMNKPLDVNTHIKVRTATPIATILREAGPTAKEPYVDTPLDFVAGCGGVRYGPGQWGRRPFLRSFGSIQMKPLQRIPDDYTPTPKFGMAIVQWAFSLVHGGVHIACWNYPFPTLAERYLWRCASTILLGILFFWGIVEVLMVKPGLDFSVTLLGIWEKTAKSNSLIRRWGMDAPATLCACYYIMARSILIFQAFFTLRDMPCSVYEEAGWTNYIPHF